MLDSCSLPFSIRVPLIVVAPRVVAPVIPRLPVTLAALRSCKEFMLAGPLLNRVVAPMLVALSRPPTEALPVAERDEKTAVVTRFRQ